MAFIALINWPLGWAGEALFGMDAGQLSLQWLLGWALAPLAWCVGIDGWQDCRLFGSLIGVKLVSTEFVAFENMANYMAQDAFQHARSAKLAAYALCGFANFASIGIQLGGITPLAPERKTDLSRLAMRAMLGGALASSCTAAVAGMFIE
jgi:CNT family concentrative nucleoside transporter